MADKFRAGTAAVIFHKDGKVLAFKRSGSADAWQFPQGGLDKKEAALDGVLREVYEETAIGKDKLKLISKHPDWLVYVFPKHVTERRHRGQAQKWFLFEFLGDDMDIDLKAAKDDEFDDWCWIEPIEMVERIVEFKKKVYQHVFEVFLPLINGKS